MAELGQRVAQLISLEFPGVHGDFTGIGKPEKQDGLDGIRTRGLHVANVTIYP